MVLSVESVEQPLLLGVGEPLEPLQQDHPRPPQQVDLPASAALGLADGAPADLVDSAGEQAEHVELVDDQPGVRQQVADGLGVGRERVDGHLLDPGQPLLALSASACSSTAALRPCTVAMTVPSSRSTRWVTNRR